TGKPVKGIEDRMENLQADSFARDYHITAELAAKKDGTLTALRIKTLADHGYTDAAANPSKFPAGLFHVCTGSYDLKAAHVEVDGVYTNKPPGGIAYRCSFRVTEAVHTIERMVDLMAHQLGVDAADFRMKNFIKPEQFPYKSALGWEYDSGNYAGALRKAMTRSATPAFAGSRAGNAIAASSWASGRRASPGLGGPAPPSTSTVSGPRCATRPGRSRPTCSRSPRTTWCGSPGNSRSRARRASRRPSRTSPSRPTPTTRRGWKPGSRPSATTIRRISPTRSAATSAWSTSTRGRARWKCAD